MIYGIHLFCDDSLHAGSAAMARSREPFLVSLFKSIRSEGLLEACRLLEKEKRAGYQEKLLDALIWDIRHGM